MLNWIPAIPMIPSIQTQLINMGIKETNVSSILPYISNKTENTSNEVINAILLKSELMISAKRLARYCLSSTVTSLFVLKAVIYFLSFPGTVFTSVTTVDLSDFSVI